MDRFYSTLVLFCITLFLTGFFLLTPPLNWGGDIIEYYGTSGSFMNHFSPALTGADQAALEKELNPAYLQDPQYYIRGANGSRYPVHFFAYSLLIIPGRLLLRLFQQDETRTFALTNVAILSLTLLAVMRHFIHSERKRILLLILVFLSPAVSFLAWPGPEILYLSLVLLTVFMFASKRYLMAALMVTLASWHSQPLLVIAAGLYCLIMYDARKNNSVLKNGAAVLGMGLLALIPYAYNLVVFGVWSPWLKLANIWTQYYGFGLQNVSLQKAAEQFFDFDIGLFWYAPVLFLIAAYYAYRSFAGHKRLLFLLTVFIAAAFFYQTNPAWNYGTAGYGPTRHILYFLPVILYFASQLRRSRAAFLALTLFVLSQSYILSFNGFLRPDFLNSLRHNPLSAYILNTYPALYNPTPELFVDRTNGTDLDYPTSAVYKENGICRKAYILPQDAGLLASECGFMPVSAPKMSPAVAKAGSVHTTQAALMPAGDTCSAPNSPCLSGAGEVADRLGIPENRIKPAAPAGSWSIVWGPPVSFTVPAGYQTTYYSFTGSYINF